MTCVEFRRLVGAYVSDQISPVERTEFRSHLTTCAECRFEAVKTEPALLFAAPPRDADRPDDVRVVLANVRAAIAVRETARRIEVPAVSTRARRRAVVALASAAVLAGVALLTPRAQAPDPPVVSSDTTAPAESAIAPARLSKSVEPVSPSSATVYEWNTNRGKPDGMKIVWIVDRSIDL